MGLRNAHEAMMVDDASEILEINRQALKHTHNTIAAAMPDSVKPFPDEDMGNRSIHVGDIYQSTPPQAAVQQQQSSGLSTAAKLAIGGLAALTGLSLPISGVALYNALKPGPEVVDTDTQYELTLPDAETTVDDGQ